MAATNYQGVRTSGRRSYRLNDSEPSEASKTSRDPFPPAKVQIPADNLNELKKDGPSGRRREIGDAGAEITESGCLPIRGWLKPREMHGKKKKT